MNCDQVFEILTRGPFPTGTACDTPVEVHLSVCPQCHRLAEALRPALELFQEAIGPEESRDLPGYWRDVAVERSQPVVSYASQIEPRRVPRRAWTQQKLGKSLSAVAAWRAVAILTLGLSVGLLVSSRVTLDGVSLPKSETSAVVPPLPAAGAPALTVSERRDLLESPADCSRDRLNMVPRYSQRGDVILAQVDLGASDCCSECHNSQSRTAPRAATVEVAKRCQFCHQD